MCASTATRQPGSAGGTLEVGEGSRCLSLDVAGIGQPPACLLQSKLVVSIVWFLECSASSYLNDNYTGWNP
jgi:hypothetical protein